MKKIFTSLLLLTAMAVTANAKMTTVWEGTHEIGDWDKRLTVEAAKFSSISSAEKLVLSVLDDDEDQYSQYKVSIKDDSYTTIIDGAKINGDGNYEISLTDEQVNLIKTYGIDINGSYYTITKVAVDTGEGGEVTPPDTPEEGTTTELWSGNTATGDWKELVALSYDNKPAALATAKIGDVITVNYSTTGEDPHVRIANPNGWESFDEKSEAAATIQDNGQTFTYTIENVATLEIIQRDGILVRGKNITITKVELTTYEDSYDAASVTISKAGIATYSNSNKALDFTNSGLTVYYASSVEKGKVTLTPISIVPAYTGIIVKGDADTYEIPVATGDIPAIEGTNYLKAVGDWDGKITASTDAIYHYSFTETTTPTFSRVTQDTDIPAHKAYLETPTDITPETGSIELVFTDGTSTGINEIETEVQESGDNSYYNLQGMRVEHPTKGIYIHKGKKIIIR